MKKSYLLLSILPSLALYGCNSGNNSNTFTPVALQWENCNPTQYKGITESMIIALGDRLSCAKMVAPVDYNNPSLGNIEVALSKVSAEIPSERKGSIFFNPGGPGGNGINMAPVFGELWADADPENQLGAKFKQLSNEYDLIGFSPRGVASSTPLFCQQIGNSYFALNPTESLSSLHNQNILYSNQGLTAEACMADDFTPFVNTDATARDMDLARSLIGDAKLSYVGYSYGTWLGTWYAGLFPSHVDKMVIDSNVNITDNLTNTLLQQPPAMQNITDNIIAPYAALNESIFNLGSTQDVQNIYPQLNNTMKTVTTGKLYNTLFKQALANTSVEILSAAKTVNQLITNNPYANQESIIEMVTEYTFSDNETVQQQTTIIATEMTKTYFITMQQQPEIVALSDTGSTNKAVKCNDTPVPTTFEDWLIMIKEISINGPIFGPTSMNETCTTKWNRPAITQPSITSMRSASPILMVQTQYDGATPLEGALKTYNALGTASMVYITNNYTHGVFSSINNGCANYATANYLLTGEVPQNQLLICQGEGLLPNMNSIASISSKTTPTSFLPANLANKATYGENVNADNAFKDPEQAQKLQQQIQDSIIDADKINK